MSFNDKDGPSPAEVEKLRKDLERKLASVKPKAKVIDINKNKSKKR